MATPAKQLKHPYVTTNRKIRGGNPVISGTGIQVLDIAIRYELMGMSPEDIIVALPHLNLSQVHDALSYYYENKNEIDSKWREAIKKTDGLKRRLQKSSKNGIASPSLHSGLRLTRSQRQMASLLSLRGV